MNLVFLQELKHIPCVCVCVCCVCVCECVYMYVYLFCTATSFLWLEDVYFTLSHQRFSQKHPSRRILTKRCSKNVQQIYRETPMPR